MWKRMFGLLTTTLLLTACAGRPTVVGDSACTAFAPIYLSEPAIQTVVPHRAAVEQIVAHNRTWEALCSAP